MSKTPNLKITLINLETTLRPCALCKVNQPLIYFDNSKSHKYGKVYTCKKCKRTKHASCSGYTPAQRKRRDAANDNREKSPKATNSLTEKQRGIYRQRVSEAGIDIFQCQGCYTTIEKTKICVDHCHETGNFRAILCHKCNTGLGLLGDNIGHAIQLLLRIQKAEATNKRKMDTHI